MNHHAATPGGSPRLGPAARICLFLALVTLGVYFQVVTFGFIDTDTPYYVYHNLVVRGGLSLDSAYWALTTFHAGNWHPLAWISHMLDVELYGLNPGGHHLTSVVLHIINALLLFHLFNKMTDAPLPGALVAALFALHPTHVESVAWVAERKDVLCAFFFFLTIRCYLAYVKTPGVWRYLLVCGCYALALAAKPMAVTLPCVLLLLDFWPLGRARGNGARLLYEKIPLLIPTLGAALLTIKAQHAAGYVESLTRLPIMVRLGNAAVSYVSYLGKTLWPTDLSFVYPHPGAQPAWLLVVSLVILLSITFFAIALVRTRAYYLIGWCWFLGTLVPVIGIVQVGSQAMADRYTYLPGVGLYIIIAWGLRDVLNHIFRKSETLSQKTYVFVALAVSGVLAVGCCNQLRYWRSSIALYEHSLRVTENNYTLHASLGYSYMSEKRYAEAEAQLREALRLNEFDAYSYINLSIILGRSGREEQALACLRNALAIEPNNHYAHFNMAKLLVKTGREDEAVGYFEATIRTKPDFPIAYNSLGKIMLKRGEHDKAAALFREALRIYPDYREARDNLRLATSGGGE